MNLIKKLLETKTPFAIIQYFEYMKINKSETHKKYEIIYINDVIKDHHHTFKKLVGTELEYFKENINKFEIKFNNKNGIVWQYGNFRSYSDLTLCKNYKDLNNNIYEN